ncbi:MAG: hypothetical protein WC916_04200 [Candidatus Woesearchaeota archaeon]
MKRSTRKFIHLSKTFLAGLIGAVLFAIIGLFAFSLLKLFYLLSQKNLLISKYTILAVFAILALVGFVYGTISFAKRNRYYDIFSMSVGRIVVTILIACVMTVIGYLLLKSQFSLALRFWPVLVIFAVFCVLLYGFSAVAVSIYNSYPFTRVARKRTHARHWILLTLLNPIFILLYFWLFGLIAYNALYAPCGVSIAGVDSNVYTANTRALGITLGEKLLTIDGVRVSSLQDVRDYMNNLRSTKEVLVETPTNIYYIKTYEENGKRYMGLLLREDTCKRVY